MTSIETLKVMSSFKKNAQKIYIYRHEGRVSIYNDGDSTSKSEHGIYIISHDTEDDGTKATFKEYIPFEDIVGIKALMKYSAKEVVNEV